MPFARQVDAPIETSHHSLEQRTAHMNILGMIMFIINIVMSSIIKQLPVGSTLD